MPVLEEQQKAVNKYLKNTFDDIKTRMPKGKREEYKEKAKRLGYESFNGFVIQAIEEKIEKGKNVCKGHKTENTTKFWIPKGGIQLEYNKSQIPTKDLKK